MSLLGKAISLAAIAHQDQLDKQGDPVILHPLMVMHEIRAHGFDETHQIVGVLHDVIEDTAIRYEGIQARFGTVIAEAVDSVTRRESEPYEKFIERAAQNDIGRVVKWFDLRHNRFGRRPIPGVERLHARYDKAMEYLLALDNAIAIPKRRAA